MNEMCFENKARGGHMCVYKFGNGVNQLATIKILYQSTKYELALG
jgi:hypothetical protein